MEVSDPPRVAVLDFPFPWSAGAPLPTLLQDENHTFLLFLTTEDDHGIGLVEFERCFATSFGSPGDETFHGHPLYSAGLRRYEAMEVFNSPWIAQLQKIDSVHPRHHPSTYADLRHFVFAFHDTTFECVAAGFTATRTDGPLSDVVKRVAERLL